MNLSKVLENSECADCGVSDPQWFDYRFGVFVCSLCAPLHKAWGFIVSVTAPWQERHLAALRLGGNKQFAEFLSWYGLDCAAAVPKYTSCAAQYYKLQLALLMNGLQLDQPPPPYKRGAEPSQKPVSSLVTGQSAAPHWSDKLRRAVEFLRTQWFALRLSCLSDNREIRTPLLSSDSGVRESSKRGSG